MDKNSDREWKNLSVLDGQLNALWEFTFLNLNPSSRLGIPKGAAVADLFIEGSWSLPPALSDEHLGSSRISKFNTGAIYSEIKQHNIKLPWFKTKGTTACTAKSSALLIQSPPPSLVPSAPRSLPFVISHQGYPLLCLLYGWLEDLSLRLSVDQSSACPFLSPKYGFIPK
ncbi:LOW QUALITY PROTEIN: hypothetical protein HID58_048104, partial [Brassica napus]